MGLPGAHAAAAATSEHARLEQLWYDFQAPEGSRLELIDGELVMSPAPTAGHEQSVRELTCQLAGVRYRHGWSAQTDARIRIPVTSERLIPDLALATGDAPRVSRRELAPDGVLLTAEVVSPSTQRRDRGHKRRAYAQGGIPLYLIIDPFAGPPTVTLLSEPGPDCYAHEQVAAAGQPLRLPPPFGLSLDTARLLPADLSDLSVLLA